MRNGEGKNAMANDNGIERKRDDRRDNVGFHGARALKLENFHLRFPIEYGQGSRSQGFYLSVRSGGRKIIAITDSVDLSSTRCVLPVRGRKENFIKFTKSNFARPFRTRLLVPLPDLNSWTFYDSSNFFFFFTFVKNVISGAGTLS